MKMIKQISPILICFFVLMLGCKKDNNVSNLVLRIKLFDENGYSVSDKSGAKIILTRGLESFHGETDSKGECSFGDFPYGIFNVQLKKNGFISEFMNTELTFHENDTLSVHTCNMVEVPNFEISIDSIAKSTSIFNTGYFGYSRLKNVKGKPLIQYNSRVYFSDKADVSKDNYLFYLYGPILTSFINGDKCIVWIRNLNGGNLIPPGYETLFVRIYPHAFNGDWYMLRDEVLGKPSEVFKWKVVY